MIPRVSLIDELKKGGYQASLITTFNAYLPFYEDVVLRKLLGSGIRHNVLMMDATEFGKSVQTYPPNLAGRSYTLLPVRVPGAFHPKLMLLMGKKKGLIVVGSHNMTLAGFGFNRELTNITRIHGSDDKEALALAAHTWQCVEHWLEVAQNQVPGHLLKMARRVKEAAPWLSDSIGVQSTEFQVIGGQAGAQPLWDQLLTLSSPDVAEVVVTGAFFDRKFEFIRRIQDDLKPKKLVVAIDPRTVDIPYVAMGAAGVDFVNASQFGNPKPEEDSATGYLHAKGIFVRMMDGSSVFASGSANPSRPAWLANEKSGNAELMFVRTGETAEATAEELGFVDLLKAPALGASDWEEIRVNSERQVEIPEPGIKTSIALADDNKISISNEFEFDRENAELLVFDHLGTEKSRFTHFREQGSNYIFDITPEDFGLVASAKILENGRECVRLIVHHVREIEGRSRTEVQKRFKEALLSLDTDTPNLGLLLECVDRIIFSNEPDRVSFKQKAVKSEARSSQSKADENYSFAIDIEDTKKSHSKKRMLLKADFSYLLDTLIYHLRLQEDKSIEFLDNHGRSEEEQIGADDDEDDSRPDLVASNKLLIEVCHQKVKTLVSRMTIQLKAYRQQKVALDAVVIKLLGVLAVMRELRNCDLQSSWVGEGETTIPVDQRKRLFEAVMMSLFEGKTSLLQPESLGEEFANSDDVARVKGLLLWLAWDCGLYINFKKPFMESSQALKERLKQNAMLLALIQTIQSDETVVDEASQSISGLKQGELDWLKNTLNLAEKCEAIKSDHSRLQSVDEPTPGDIAIHRTLLNNHLRFVNHADSSRVSLMRLDEKKSSVVFQADHVKVLRLQDLSYG